MSAPPGAPASWRSTHTMDADLHDTYEGLIYAETYGVETLAIPRPWPALLLGRRARTSSWAQRIGREQRGSGSGERTSMGRGLPHIPRSGTWAFMGRRGHALRSTRRSDSRPWHRLAP